MALVDGLFIKITADPSGLDSGLNKAQNKLDGFGGQVKKLGQNLVAAFSVYAIYDYTKEAMRAYDEVVKAEAKVAQAIKQTGGAVRLSFTELKDESARLKGLTLFDDDQILNNATAQLLTFTNIAGDNFKRAQVAAMDLSTVLDGDLKAASIQVGKALNDPTQGLKALSRSGVQFSSEQTALIKSLAETNRLAEAQAIILDELSRQYGGQAEAAARADAKFTQTGILIRDLTEDYGKLMAAWSKELPKVAQVAVSMLSATLKNMTPDDYTEEAQRTVDANTKMWLSLTPGGDVPAKIAKVQEEYQKLKGVVSSSKFGENSTANLNAQFSGQGFLEQARDAALKRITSPQETTKKELTYTELEAQLTELQIQKETATAKDIAGINRRIEAKQKEIKKWEDAGKAVDGAAGSIKGLTNEIKALEDQRDNAVGVAEAGKFNDLIKAKQKEVELLKEATAAWTEYQKVGVKAMAEILRAQLKPATLKDPSAYRDAQMKSALNAQAQEKQAILDKAEQEQDKKNKAALKKQQDFNNQFSGVIQDGMTNMLTAGIEAAAGGGNVGKALLGQFGSTLVQLGKLLIVQSGVIKAFKVSLSTMNPIVALVAGGIAIAAGAAIMGAASHMGDGGGGGGAMSGGGGDYGSGGSNIFDTRGMRSGSGQEIVLRVQGKDLVAVTNTNQLYYNRRG
ncbi:MAG: hypothetical protein JZU65_06075 [Chlorobium sp.]|nr:hypothetical protein [Chlorobium sp.]